VCVYGSRGVRAARHAFLSLDYSTVLWEDKVAKALTEDSKAIMDSQPVRSVRGAFCIFTLLSD
jgi:hypothetical protein